MQITWRSVATLMVGVAIGGLLLTAHGGNALVGSAGADSDSGEQPFRLISTTGTATVRVKPDSARVFFSVTKAAPTVAEVRTANVESTNNVMVRLEDLGIENMFTKTSTVSVKIVWQENRSLVIEGYRMSTQFTVRVVNEDVEALADAAARTVDVALEAGANEISQIAFFREDDREERRECLMAAVADARANAEALAEAAGVKLRGPLNISGQPQYGYYGSRNNASMVQAAGPTGSAGEASSYTPGDVQLQCYASVSFEFE